MAAPLLTLDDIHLTFGGTPLLSGAGFLVHERDRLCLVGRNGSGKSTLLKIAAGLMEPDSGNRVLRSGTTARYLPQEPSLAGYETIGDYAAADLPEEDGPYMAHAMLEELGLDPAAEPLNLSGGEARRAAIVRTLVTDPDIVLLDEPTNHLDLPAIEWLEKTLSRLRSALILISHDRRFLENLSKATIWIDRGTCRRLDKGFAHFEAWRDDVFEQEASEHHKLGRQVVREEHWLTYGVTARRKRNVRRLKELHELRAKHKGAKGPQGKVQASAAQADASGKRVFEGAGLTKSYDGPPIVRDLDLRIMRGDRVGIIGPNGAGKTTLIRMLTGDLEPDDGTVEIGTNIEMVTLDQKRESLDPTWTLAQAMTDGRGDQVMVGDTPRHVVSYMKDFLFAPEQKGTPIDVLSGGERGRLMLARALAKPSNLLVLDEPTNDLDLETLDVLQDVLGDYDGTVLLVSHDRDFIDRIVTRTLVADGHGRWEEYPGGYSDLVAQRGYGVRPMGKAAAPHPGAPKKPRPAHNGSDEAADQATERASEQSNGAQLAPQQATPAQGSAVTSSPSSSGGEEKLTFKEKHLLDTLPDRMAQLEDKISKLQERLAEPDLYSSDPDLFNKVSQTLAKAQSMLADAEEEWLALEMRREASGS